MGKITDWLARAYLLWIVSGASITVAMRDRVRKVVHTLRLMFDRMDR